MEKLPVYKLVISDDEENSGVDAIAFVDSPAILLDWQAFAVSKNSFQIVSTEKRLVSGLAMVADMPIYRRDDSGREYYCLFDKETIEKIRDKFSKKSLFHSINEMHDSATPINDVFMVESYLTDESRGIVAPKSYTKVPDGSWVVTYKVNNDKIWEDVKAEKFKGFSIEGYFKQVLVDEKPMHELDSIANEIASLTELMVQFIKTNFSK